MYTSHHPCWDAKNRYGLDEELPFDYAEIAHILMSSQRQEVRQPVENKMPETKPTVPETDEGQKDKKVDPIVDIPDGAPEQLEFDPDSGTVKEEDQKKKPPEPDMSKTRTFRLNSYIPKALQDLMYEKLVSEEELLEVVYRRGYFPRGTPFQNLPDEFVEGCLIAAWPKVLAMIQEIRSNYEIPFE